MGLLIQLMTSYLYTIHKMYAVAASCTHATGLAVRSAVVDCLLGVKSKDTRPLLFCMKPF